MHARPPIALTTPPLTALALLALSTAITAGAARNARAGLRAPRPPSAAGHSPATAATTPRVRAGLRWPAGRIPYGTGRGPGSHLCPVPGCRQPVSPARFMCRPHWYQLPRPIRDTVWATWRSGNGTGTPEHTTALLAAISAASTAPARP
ncbi:MAG TPA: hypothetical protein VNF47_10070 [Streptosporangiaceae bacterium]|nr:hypothetical protein [Streptosporangiaceae bacterium]